MFRPVVVLRWSFWKDVLSQELPPYRIRGNEDGYTHTHYCRQLENALRSQAGSRFCQRSCACSGSGITAPVTYTVYTVSAVHFAGGSTCCIGHTAASTHRTGRTEYVLRG